MRPLRLTIENLHSFRGPHTVDFEHVGLAVFSGPNGAGKSTFVVDASRFVLFGQSRHGLNSLITDGEDTCRVEMEFALGDERYLVSRTRSSKGNGSTVLSFQLLGDAPVILDGANIGETQDRIEGLLKMDDELFTATVCANQGNAAQFSKAKPAERKAVLEAILDLGAWAERATIVRETGREVATETESQMAAIDALRKQAAQSRGIRTELRALRVDTDAADAMIKVALTAAEKGRECRTEIIREREADTGQRAKLSDVAKRAEEARVALDTQSKQVARIENSITSKDRITKALKKAEEADAALNGFQQKHQTEIRLTGEYRLAAEKVAMAMAGRERDLSELRQRVADSRTRYDRRVIDLRQSVQDLEAQVEPLENIPCSGTKYEQECPLIEMARQAREKLPGMRQRLEQLEDHDPVAEDSERLAELEQEDIAVEEAHDEERIREELDALGYDADEHGKAKHEAAKAPLLRQEWAEILAGEARLTVQRAQLELAIDTAGTLAAERSDLEEALGPARLWHEDISEADEAIRKAEADEGAHRSNLQDYERQRGVLDERLERAQASKEQADEKTQGLRAADRRLEVLKVLARAYGRDGIPALLIEKALPEFEAVANETLHLLSDGRMSLVFECQRETTTHQLAETLDIVVSDERGVRPYENFSGGEAMRVDMAIRIGLSVLLANRAGARIDMLVLDETCAPLDAEGQRLFAECLHKVSEYFGLILVISHVEALKDLFACRFDVHKDGDGSHVEMVAA